MDEDYFIFQQMEDLITHIYSCISHSLEQTFPVPLYPAHRCTPIYVLSLSEVHHTTYTLKSTALDLVQPDSSFWMLPQELVDLIVDELAASNDTHSLCSCALVSRAFHYRAYKHLFSKIKLVVDNTINRRARCLRKILELDPGLIPRIHQVRVIVCNWPERDRQLQVGVGPFPRFPSVPALQLFPFFRKSEFLKVLQVISHTHIRRFIIEGRRYRGVDWSMFNSREQDQLLVIGSNPFLETLEIVNMDNITGSIVAGTLARPQGRKLCHLVLKDCTFAAPRSFDWNAVFPPLPQIKTLEIWGRAYSNFPAPNTQPLILQGLGYPTSRFPALVNLALDLNVNRVEVASASCIMTGAARSILSLEILDLGVSNTNPTHLAPISLSALVNLARLTFKYPSATENFRGYSTHNCLAQIAQLLSSAKSPMQLECITIDLSVRFRNPTKDASAWAPVDLALRSSKFRNLKQVIVKSAFCKEDDSWGAGQDGLAQAWYFLPGLSARGRVSIQVDVHPLAPGILSSLQNECAPWCVFPSEV